MERFEVLNDPFFVCDNCGQYYQDLEQLEQEGKYDYKAEMKRIEAELTEFFTKIALKAKEERIAKNTLKKTDKKTE